MKKSDNKIKLVAACAVALFSVITCVTGTIAWFTASRISNNDNDSLQVVCPNGVFSRLSIHTCVNITNSTYQFNQTEQGSITYNTSRRELDKAGNATISMGTYDLLERHHPILLLIQLDKQYTVSAEFPLIIHANTEEPFIGTRTDANPVTRLGNPLSSVVEFSSNGYTASEYNAFKVTNGYSYVDENEETISYNTIDMAIPTTTDSFVKFSNDGITYNGFDSSLNLFEPDNGDNIEYISIIFDFYETALDYIYNVFLGNEILEEQIGFVCDWEMII